MRTKMALILTAIVVYNLVSWKVPLGLAFNIGRIPNYKCQATSCGSGQCFFSSIAPSNVCCAADTTKGSFCVYTGQASDYCTILTSVVQCQHCEIVGIPCPTACPATTLSGPINIDRCAI